MSFLIYAIIVFYQRQLDKFYTYRNLVRLLNFLPPMFLILGFTFDLFKWIVFILSTASNQAQLTSQEESRLDLRINLA